MRRRDLLGGAAAAFLPSLQAEPAIPIRAITAPPLYHWFGYYDKLQFDPDSHYALGIGNNFQHRLPTADDFVHVGMIDLKDHDRWIELGKTYAWSWHQGCMLQWLPGSRDEVIWNERQDDRFVARVMNVKTRKSRLLSRAIYCLSPDARWALGNDFARSFSMRPETGYAGVRDRFSSELAPRDSGIWRIDLASGKSELILSLADIAKVSLQQGDWTGARHYFDHLLINPDGTRFAVIQRWSRATGEFTSRLFTADAQGRNVRILDESGRSSHYIWRDPENLLLWTSHPSHGDRFYVVNERTVSYQPLSDEMKKNGHVTYLPGNRWVLCDTSPGAGRLQHVYVFDTRTQRKIEIGAFHSPAEYTGVWRCDTTPRHNADGTLVAFDSPHGGNGRQIYLADISSLAGQP